MTSCKVTLSLQAPSSLGMCGKLKCPLQQVAGGRQTIYATCTDTYSTFRACMHDPAVFEDPDVFRPERFIRDGKLDASARDPAAFGFGFGRRYVPVVDAARSSRLLRHFAGYALAGISLKPDYSSSSRPCCTSSTLPLRSTRGVIRSRSSQRRPMGLFREWNELPWVCHPLTGVPKISRRLSLHNQTSLRWRGEADTLKLIMWSMIEVSPPGFAR